MCTVVPLRLAARATAHTSFHPPDINNSRTLLGDVSVVAVELVRPGCHEVSVCWCIVTTCRRAEGALTRTVV